MTQVKSHSGIRWGRWLLGVALGIVLLAVGLHTIWNFSAANRVKRRIAALQAAGEPILPADFVVRDLDIPGNASPDIIAAMAMIQTGTPAWKQFDSLEPALPLRADEILAITALLNETSAALKQFDATQGKTIVRWNAAPESPVMFQLIPELNQARSMAQVLRAAALLAHEQGNETEAFKRLDQMMLLSRHADLRPFLVSHLVSAGIAAMASATASQMAADLRIGVDPRDVSPQDIRDLIDALLDPAPATDGLRLSLRGERMALYDMTRVMLSGAPVGLPGRQPQPYLPGGRRVMAPLINRNTELMFDHLGTVISLADEPDLPSARSKLPKMPARSLMNRFANMLLPSMDRAIEAHFRVTTDRRLAAASLALRWYALEHDGKLPEKLDSLVPKYLPAEPIDAMTAGQLLRYDPRAAYPIVYSVGLNGKDDGGSVVQAPGRGLGRSEWDLLDRVNHLTPQPRKAPETDDADEPEHTPSVEASPGQVQPSSAPATRTA